MLTKSKNFSLSQDDKCVNIAINIDNFNFISHQEFRSLYKKIPQATNYKLDFSKVNYVDSSALGMLLLLREHNGENNKLIELVNCGNAVEELLHMSNFDSLFEVVTIT